MEVSIQKEVTVNVTRLQVKAGIRYYEDVTINGVSDDEGINTPCVDGEYWCPMIDIDTGLILNWQQGKKAEIHAKVCDDGSYYLLDENGEKVVSREDSYVPVCLAIGDNGYGDYIILNIDENGKIQDWKFEIENF